MIVLLVLVVLTAVLYWCAKMVRGGGRRLDGEPDTTPAGSNQLTATSMAWTAVDDRQFQRLADGTSSDGAG